VLKISRTMQKYDIGNIRRVNGKKFKKWNKLKRKFWLSE
jgi:hypothetical protein